MKIMFTTRYAGQCLCLLMVVCVMSCSVSKKVVKATINQPTPALWILKVAFRTGYDPGGRWYALTTDATSACRIYSITHAFGLMVFEYHCSDKEQCTALEQELSSLGDVILISTHELSE